MTITPAHLTVMRVDAEATRQCVAEARPLMPESGPVVYVFTNAAVLAGHVDRLCAEVERLSALLAVATKHHDTCLGACGCGVCAWVKASRKAGERPTSDEPCPGSRGW